METGKVRTYLGFALRARKLTLGVQAAKGIKKDAFLMIADRSVAPNNRKEIEKLRQKLSCPLLFLEGLDLLTGKDFCKLAVVRDKNLAEAILRAESSESRE